MKRVLFTVIFLVLLTTQLWATGSSSKITDYGVVGGKNIITISWVADNATGAVPNLTIDPTLYNLKGWYLYSAETNPGSTAPTDLYDITLTDADGLDIAWSLLNNRSTTNTELVLVSTASTGFPVIRGNLTFTLTNNSVNSATGTLILIFIPQ